MTEETKSGKIEQPEEVHPQKSFTAAGCHVLHDILCHQRWTFLDEFRKIKRIICIRLWGSTLLVRAGIAARTNVGQPQGQFGGECQMLKNVQILKVK